MGGGGADGLESLGLDVEAETGLGVVGLISESSSISIFCAAASAAETGVLEDVVVGFISGSGSSVVSSAAGMMAPEGRRMGRPSSAW